MSDKYLAIIVCVEPGGIQNFTLSREVETDDVDEVYAYMRDEAKAHDDSVDTILLLKNGDTSPEVVEFWRAENGDFSSEDENDEDDEEVSDDD